ncbi:MAG: hypothetical protein U0V75_13685 [Ferruginibacter sp.]
MIKKALLFALMAATTFCKTPAQSKKIFAATHTVYAEGSTQGPVYSLNYDKIFSQGRIFAKSFRAGFSVYNDVLAVPAGLNFISGKSAHHAELDITVVLYIEKFQQLFSAGNLSDKKLYIMPGAGYRYQRPAGGFFFKAIASPVLYLDPPSDHFWNMDTKFYAGLSIAAGFSF